MGVESKIKCMHMQTILTVGVNELQLVGVSTVSRLDDDSSKLALC